MRRALMLFMAAAALFCGACQRAATPQHGEKLVVAVAIVPLKTFVERIGGERVEVAVMVPPGYSPENYQPTVQSMRALSDALLYFTLRLPAEEAAILPKLGDFNADLRLVDLQAAAAEVYATLTIDHSHADEHHDHGEDEGEHIDHHSWLSPRRAAVMAQAITDALIAADGENAAAYEANARVLIDELQALDAEVAQALSPLENRSFLIYHSAYGYFADDYGLDMVSIEIAGKQATAADLRRVIDFAREHDIHTVFYQDEFDDSQARTIASEISGTAQKVSPLSADYVGAIREFTHALLGVGGQDE